MTEVSMDDIQALQSSENMVLALPKGRILKAIRPILKSAGLNLKKDFLTRMIAAFALPRSGRG